MKLRLLTCLIPAMLCALSAPAQEFRGVWVASVWNINFPSKPGLSAEEQKRQIISILEHCRRAGLEHVFVQIRPEGCALYSSKLEPWSRFLTGKQGQSPGYDPLETFIQEGRKRGLRIHGWFNPYRASINVNNARAASHMSNRLARHTKRVGNMLWMDPGARAVQEHTIAVIRDVVRRYDLAGVHLDDYFYPYPPRGKSISFPDDDTYSAYRAGGGKLSRVDWRRQNVNTLVRAIHQVVKSEKPNMLFGISPFGIYTRGQPPEIKAGLDQYNQLFADPLLWMRQGWVDYIAPQLYWRDGGPQCFTTLLRWWRSPAVNPRGVPVYPGIALDRLGGEHRWPVSEIATQLRAERAVGPRRAGGFILYNIGPVMADTKGVRSVLGR